MDEKNLTMFESLLEDPIEQPVEGAQEIITNEPVNVEEPVEPTNTPYSDNVMYQFLQQRGIADPSKIKFENEDGELEDHDFNSLTPEEQLTILAEITDPGLSEHETDVINYLRTNRVSFDQVVDYFAQQKLEAYLNEHPDQVHQKTYAIDDYSNEELYYADMKAKYPSFSDEELMSKLESAKANEELFEKEVEMLRTQYKEAEEEQIRLEKQRADQYQEDLRNNLAIAANNFKEFPLDYMDKESDAFEIEDSDREIALNYLLQQDSSGKSQFVKDLEDPTALIELAWYKTQGRDVIANITRYWKDILKAERKEMAKLKSQLEASNKKSTTSHVIPGPKDNPSEPISVTSLWSRDGLI
ncbi:MAG: hypothetical protein J6V44_12085 [Methanobrevibacter sp.]|nr:hypothetical protein [Methanobrevibacter sp.]